jgi:hypothetical protein
LCCGHNGAAWFDSMSPDPISPDPLSTSPPVATPLAQLWAPGIDASWLIDGFSQARLQLHSIADPGAAAPGLPLLLAYGEPASWPQLLEPSAGPSGVEAVAEALPRLLASDRPCRLVNLSCTSVPTLVAWCLEPRSALCSQIAPRFVHPNPLDALLALDLLQRQPHLLATYQQLEQQPCAAAIDGRSADLQPFDRYRQATVPEALRQQRQQQQALEVELDLLTAQLQSLQLEQLEGLGRRELLESLPERLAEAEQLKRHASDLELSLEAQQADLRVVLHRLSALEQVLATGAQASQRLQQRLPQLLALGSSASA